MQYEHVIPIYTFIHIYPWIACIHTHTHTYLCMDGYLIHKRLWTANLREEWKPNKSKSSLQQLWYSHVMFCILNECKTKLEVCVRVLRFQRTEAKIRKKGLFRRGFTFCWCFCWFLVFFFLFCLCYWQDCFNFKGD